MFSRLPPSIRSAVRGNAFRFGSNRELRRLAEYLHDGENVLSIVTGSRDGKRGRGLVVATSERILFIWDGWVFRENQDYPYDTISSVEFETRVFFGKLTLYGLGDDTSYDWVDRFAGNKFAKTVRQLAVEAKAQKRDGGSLNTQTPPTAPTPVLPTAPIQQVPPVPQVQVPSEGDREAEAFKNLARLGDLRDRGYITPSDYDTAKQRLLNEL